ncbi:MAG: hypothetical protein H0V07_00255 [Propionibacteriales bacterium]|nr:hypothetical protein [Propionibacteriales bacterium]
MRRPGATAFFDHWGFVPRSRAEWEQWVDTNTATGAFSLYERVGYRVVSRTATYQLVLQAPMNRVSR